MGVEVLTQREVTLRGRESVRIRIGIEDNSVYDGGEDRTFAVVLSLLGSDFERVNVTSDYIEVRIVDDEPQPEGETCTLCVCACLCACVCVYVCVRACVCVREKSEWGLME